MEIFGDCLYNLFNSVCKVLPTVPVIPKVIIIDGKVGSNFSSSGEFEPPFRDIIFLYSYFFYILNILKNNMNFGYFATFLYIYI